MRSKSTQFALDLGIDLQCDTCLIAVFHYNLPVFQSELCLKMFVTILWNYLMSSNCFMLI